jgi:hypothetical protein
MDISTTPAFKGLAAVVAAARGLGERCPLAHTGEMITDATEVH